MPWGPSQGAVTSPSTPHSQEERPGSRQVRSRNPQSQLAKGAIQPDSSIQEIKRLKLNAFCPHLKRVRECTNLVNDRLLFFLSCILSSYF